MSNFKIVFRSLHIVWVIIGVCVTFVLAISKGHPPGIIFVPFALVIWGIGHVFLWLSHKLAIQGRNIAENRNNDERRWPLVLTLLLFFFGGIFFIGFIQIILTMMDKYSRQSELLIILVIWLPSSICFVGILLRQAWSRIVASGGFIVVALLLLYQMVESLLGNSRHSVKEWIVAIAILVLFLFIGQHIYRSPNIKAFYSK